jgi:uncharacterized protein (DUF885 family)
MAAQAKAQGFKDLAAFRESIKKDSKWTPKDEAQIVADFKKYIDAMQPKLPALFGLLPKAPVTVEGIPPFDAAAATHYVRGTPDGKRAGRVVVAVADPTHRSLVNDEAVAYHEGVPGHHMQLSIAQELTGLPKFRQFGGGFTAYTEGWALYSEELGKEVGLYQDPVSDYGRLNSELFRAVRLVVDTGMHAKGWSRDKAIAYFTDNAPKTEQDIVNEIDRYIGTPGQALAYKIGQMRISELRARAARELGPRFDLRRFNDAVLETGSVPLQALDRHIEAWIALQKAAPQGG